MVIEVTGYYDNKLGKRSRQPGTSARDPVLLTRKRAMGLYKRLLEERAEEERCRVGTWPIMWGLNSKVLGRRLEDSNRRPGYAADLSMMHQLITRGPRSAGEGMRLGSLKAKHRKEYGELRAEWQGQQELS